MNDRGQPEQKSAPETESEKNKRSVWIRELPLERETCWFILVNALDVFMTYILLNLEGFRESNAIANYVLSRWGIRGMVYFKFGLVAFTAIVAQIAARKHIRIGRWLLNIGTLIIGGVVVYSGYLMFLWLGKYA